MLALVATAALFASALAETDPPARYALELSVVRNGVTTVSTRSVLIEDGSASISITDSERDFEMTARLTAVQGDGDGQLALSLSIADGEAPPKEPNLLFERGETARLEIGDEDPTGWTINGLTLNVTPVAGPPATAFVSPATPNN